MPFTAIVVHLGVYEVGFGLARSERVLSLACAGQPQKSDASYHSISFLLVFLKYWALNCLCIHSYLL